MGEIFNTTRQYINSKRYTKTIRAEAAAVKAQVTQALWFLAKWFYNLVAREARAQCVNRVWVLASCKLAALIFTCIYLMVSAMTSYSSLTSRRIFVSRQHSTESDFEFHQCPKYSRRAVFSSSAKQCLLSVNLKPFLMQTEQQTQERRIVNPRRGRFDTEKSSGARTPTWNSTAQATKMETASTNSGVKGTWLNEFRMLK